MKKTNILVIGRNTEIRETIVRLINNNPQWQAIGTGDDDDAIASFQHHAYDLVILGGGILPESELKLRRIFSILNPSVKVIQHWGGGSGLLSNEIIAALEDNKSGNFYIKDDLFG